jgi:hypothetical protein
MTIESAFGQLRARLARLQEALDALGTTVDEDRPQRSQVAAASYLGDAVLATRGALEEACEALDADALHGNEPAARLALLHCHRRFHDYARQFSGELASHERLDDLAHVARDWGREWADWVGVVREELVQCTALADEVADALLTCWQELVERGSGVTVQNTVTGQRIGLPMAS